jgi:alpha-N-arabinofuranosidase
MFNQYAKSAAAFALSCAFVFSGHASEPTNNASITVHADKPGATISKYVYGQFAEHLGRGVYEGVWVGENSTIPNTHGYRNDVVAALKKIHVPIVRWPGGCFADEYHWREGIGPRDQRPRKVNTWWGGVGESNEFGTHEFLNFAELIGADAYVNGNVGSATPQEMAEWVEYMTSDSDSSLAQLRRKNGRDKPWHVAVFAVGNETWGCGGNMRAEYYADLYRQYSTFIKAPPSNMPLKIASGANSDDYHWTDVLMSQAAKMMDAASVHYYTLPTGEWKHKGAATGFNEDEWASTLKRALHIEDLINGHSAVMDKYDPQKKVALFVDEWGTWYDPTPGMNPSFLWQQNTLRDALVAGLSLNVFHRHADRVRMANIAQMVNVLQAMILTDKDKMLLTPTYYVFDMYSVFQNATYLPADVTTPRYRQNGVELPALDVSVARTSDGRVFASFINLDPEHSATVSSNLIGMQASRMEGRVLTATTMDAHNTFDKADAIKPAPIKSTRRGGNVVLELPAMSVSVVELIR